MPDSLFGGLGSLGGIMKGLTSFMPQDDPDTKILKAQNELSELQQRELQLYAEIGTKVYQSICDNPEYAVIINELKLTKAKVVQIKEDLGNAEKEKSDKERIEEEKLEAVTCPNCQMVNPEGVKFCQDCGSKLGISNQFICSKCGTKNPPQTRFCGECGNRFS